VLWLKNVQKECSCGGGKAETGKTGNEPVKKYAGAHNNEANRKRIIVNHRCPGSKNVGSQLEKRSGINAQKSKACI
jgi:hypothetical protein